MFNELTSILHIKLRIVSFGWFIVLINSRKSTDNWKQILKLQNANILYFFDKYDIRDQFINYSTKNNKYVFSRGFSNRDWKKFLEIVTELPYIKFKYLAHKNQWNKNWIIPNNLEVKYNTSSTEYYEDLKKAYCSIFVCVPNLKCWLN